MWDILKPMKSLNKLKNTKMNKPRLTEKVLRGLRNAVDQHLQQLPDVSKDEESDLMSALKWVKGMIEYRTPFQKRQREIRRIRRGDPLL